MEERAGRAEESGGGGRPEPAKLFCAFLDILGFSQMLADWDTALGHYDRFMVKLGPALLGAHTRLRKAGRRALPADTGRPEPFFRYSFISDSIFIRAEDAFDVIRATADVAQYFLEQGCLIRGGIGYGEHFEDLRKGNFFVVSRALVEAYTLESRVARHPRIVFSASAFEAFLEQKGIVEWPDLPWRKVHLEHTWASHVIQCEDDLWCINPFFWHNPDETQQEFRNQIETWLRKYEGQKPHDKYVWLADLWNHANYGPRWLREERGLQGYAINTGAPEEHRFILMSVMKNGFNNPIYAQTFAENELIYNRILGRDTGL